MSDANPTERMHQLLSSVQQALRDLDAGKLDLEGLERASGDAQALYERLVILRHKAREGRSTPATAAAKEPPPVTAPPELPSLRLDTRPTETPTRQTSLIDAIAETEKPASPPKAAPPEHVRATSVPPTRPPRTSDKPATPGPSLADKLEKAPINDLHKAIALSQKFWFVAELFAGQRERYEKAIDAINALSSAEEARTFVAKEIVGKAARPPAEDALQAFTELVDRRFK